MHHEQKEVLEPWAAELEKRTNGRIKVEIFPAQALGKQSEQYDLVLKGTADISWLPLTALAGRFPLEECFQLPYLIPGAMGDPLGDKIRNMVYEKYLNPIQHQDVHLLWHGRYGTLELHMVDKAVRTLEDMNGLVIGFPGGKAPAIYLPVFGATPERVLVPEMYTNLERGVVDGVVAPLEILVTFKLGEVQKYNTQIHCGGASFIIPMRLETWNSLSLADQKIIDELTPWVVDIQTKAWMGSTQHAYSVAEEAGVEIIELPPEEMARWVKATEPIELEWVKEVEAMGLPARDMYDDIKKMVAGG